ncbi:MAG: hypothetical protein PF445_00240, partial [Melioribacteraceae bacterium]|nr:hypothetical protein [Melioribacteraceae bacterium]
TGIRKFKFSFFLNQSVPASKATVKTKPIYTALNNEVLGSKDQNEVIAAHNGKLYKTKVKLLFCSNFNNSVLLTKRKTIPRMGKNTYTFFNNGKELNDATKIKRGIIYNSSKRYLFILER